MNKSPQERPPTDVQLLTLPQVAERLQVSISDVRRKIREGKLPCVRLGPRQIRVHAADLGAYVEARRAPAPPPDDAS